MIRRFSTTRPWIAALCLLLASCAAHDPGCEYRRLPGNEAALLLRKVSFEVVHGFGDAPGNVAVGPDGRIFMSLHPFYNPTYRVVEVQKDGSLTPYPNAWLARGEEWKGLKMDSILGLRVDKTGVLWLLDNGLRSKTTPQLIGWDTRRNRLHKTIPLPAPVSVASSFLNDLAVDPERGMAYIADPAQGNEAALIVVNLRNGLARRVLQGAREVAAEPGVSMSIHGQEVGMGSGETWKPAAVGINPITLDHEGKWLYFGPMNGTTLYRVETRFLRDMSLDDAQLDPHVEYYGKRPVSDGATVDSAGNVYITDVTHDSIGYVSAKGKYERILTDPEKLSWPDSLAVGPDGYIYGVSNQLHRSPPLNRGTNTATPPHYLFRFKPLAPAIVGR